MVVLNLYCVFDKALGESSALFEAKNDAVAFRNFQQMLKQTPWPDHLRLVQVGTFDREAMELKVVFPGREIPVAPVELNPVREENARLAALDSLAREGDVAARDELLRLQGQMNLPGIANGGRRGA